MKGAHPRTRFGLRMGLVLVGLVWLAAAEARAGPGGTPVLILQSYHQGMRWADDVTAGMQEVLQQEVTNAEVSIEYMDTKRFPEPEATEAFLTWFKGKYRHWQPAVILCADDAAFTFLLRYKRELFPGTPVSFCGVNYFRPSMLAAHTDFTGVVESYDLAGTLDLALRLHPRTREIVIVNDRTVTGQSNRLKIDEVLPAFTNRVSVRFVDDVTLDELTATLSALPSTSLVVLMTFNLDRAGRVIQYEELARRLSPLTPVPLYGVWDFYLGEGVLGGVMTRGKDHGRLAAELAVRLLRGVPATALPVITSTPSRVMFDFRQMQRFGLRERDLPRDARILHLPSPFLPVRRGAFYGTIALVVLLVTFIAALLLDIRKRRRAETALRESEEQFHQFMRHLPGCASIKDGQGRIVYANAVFRRVFWGRETALQGLRDDDLWPAETAQRLKRDDSQVRRDGRMLRRIERLPHRSGELHSYLMYRFLIPRRRTEPLLGMVAVDITEQRNAEDALRRAHDELEQRVKDRTEELARSNERLRREIVQRQHVERELAWRAEELQRSNADLEQFAYVASHDLREPLRKIAMFGETLGESRAVLSESARDALDRMIAAANRMHGLIDSLLTYARVSVRDVAFSAVDLAEVAREVVADLDPRIQAATAQVEIGALPVIEADRSQMVRLLSNLLVNALKFRRPDVPPRIRVSAETPVRDPAGRDGCCLISVEDNGLGFDEALRDRVFQPFQRLHGRAYEGYGLGLSICRRIVEGHGGRITATSMLGKGSRFMVWLPLRQAKADPSGESPLAPTAPGSEATGGLEGDINP